jgi:hypothetical protein
LPSSLDFSRTTTLHEDSVLLILEVNLMVSLSNLKVRPLLDDRLMAILKLDIGIYNIGIKVSKCILVDLLELFFMSTNLSGAHPPPWMIFHTSSASSFPLSIPEVLIN